jgi:hypothetical protein
MKGTMPKRVTKSRSTLRAPYDIDRRNRHCMEAAHFRSFYHFEPDIRASLKDVEAGDADEFGARERAKDC